MVNMRPNIEYLLLLHTQKNPPSVSGRLHNGGQPGLPEPVLCHILWALLQEKKVILYIGQNEK
jgi:hypothetical protein